MLREKLIKRLSWYYPTELFNAFLFTGIFVYVLVAYPFANALLLLYGLFLMIVILFQGQHYWKLKLYRIQGKPINQSKNIRLFKRAKVANAIIIFGILPVALLQGYITNWCFAEKGITLWAIGANAFGILEHINYYYRQLMIDNTADVEYLKVNKKLKTASLAKDLRDNKF